MPNNNRNSRGFQSRDVVNERAEAASSRDYQGNGMVQDSHFVGQRTCFDDRFSGLTSMTRLAKNGLPMATK